MSRMELALSFIDKNNTSKFENMEDLIHIDEKWFYREKSRSLYTIQREYKIFLLSVCNNPVIGLNH